MKRHFADLANTTYDLIVVGGGIFGACAAWDATARGLKVALLEKSDFGAATSARHFKMVHGGIRYLQHGDIVRTRESSHERSAFLRTAPHLIRPLPIVIPTYGHGMQGKEILRFGTMLYDTVTADRNQGIADRARHIPGGQAIDRDETLRMFPGVNKNGLTGAVIFNDGQIYNPPRHVLAYVKSAVAAGCDAVNYTEVTDLLQQGDRVIGVRARDTLTGEKTEVRGRMVLNAAGPWANRLVRRWMGSSLVANPTFSRDACFVVDRQLLHPTHALAVLGETADPDALLSRGHRHLFVVPWRKQTLVGVWHVVHQGAPEDWTVTENDLATFISEINASYPLDLTLDDVALWNAGLVLFGENVPGQKNLSYGKRSLLIDHAQENRIDGLVTMIGVRYTTGRGVAEKAIDLVYQKLGQIPPKSTTATTPLVGGAIENFERLVHNAAAPQPFGLGEDVLRNLISNHGTRYIDVLKYAGPDRTLAQTLGDSANIRAEVVHAVREEMAQTLPDVVFRRTDLGTGGSPGQRALRECAETMAHELGWNDARIQQELAAVAAIFPQIGRRDTVESLEEDVVAV